VPFRSFGEREQDRSDTVREHEDFLQFSEHDTPIFCFEEVEKGEYEMDDIMEWLRSLLF